MGVRGTHVSGCETRVSVCSWREMGVELVCEGDRVTLTSLSAQQLKLCYSKVRVIRDIILIALIIIKVLGL